MKVDIIKDQDFLLAEQYVENTGVSVFLTGKAGTGKTTFLRYIHETTTKNHVVLAPTGVAAVNAGGVTIHSFFQLPFDPYLPDLPDLKTEYQSRNRYKFGRKKVKIIRSLELLIIDEISMVRADILDAIDMVLRTWRNTSRPFGGVQLLLIGDPSQLSPVATANERYYLDQVYPSPYFFHSKALSKIYLASVELTSVYRQRDAHFVDILNAVRDRRVDSQVLAELNSRLDPDFKEVDGWIRLTTHNATANDFNSQKLEAISRKTYTYKASVSGDFPRANYPVEEEIVLKVGAQVMFVRNNLDEGYYNGKIGKVKSLSEDGIVVSTKGKTRDVDITVPRMTWENIKYDQSEETGEIEPQVVGTFIQFPLRLAWAITIHKSQSLTFDNVIIDASRAFAFGQVYVALSRCTSLEGIVLSTPISSGNIYNDHDVASFENSYPGRETLQGQVSYWENVYWEQCVSECFDFGGLLMKYEQLWEKWTGSKLNHTETKASELIDEQYGRLNQLEDYANKFRGMIHYLHSTDPEGLITKTRSAAKYYKENFEDLFIKVEETIRKTKIPDGGLKEEIMDANEEFMLVVGLHLATFEGMTDDGFDLARYRKAKIRGSSNPSFEFYESILRAEEEKRREEMRRAREEQIRRDKEREVQAKAHEEAEKAHRKAEREQRRLQRKTERDTVASSSGKKGQPSRVQAIVDSLRRMRDAISRPGEVPALFDENVLRRIAEAEPSTRMELRQVKGVGKSTVSRYGERILSAVQQGVDRSGKGGK